MRIELIAISLIIIILAIPTIKVYAQTFGKVFGVYEDELVVVNFRGEAKIIAMDDFMNRTAIKELWNQFNNHVDTFDVEDIHD